MAMPCPVCQTMLSAASNLNEEDMALLQNLPYVIAYPLKKTLEEKHAWTKINLFKDTFLNYLKYLGLLSASEFFNSPFKDKRMVALFHNTLAEPSFGTWNLFIRETLAYLKENNHSFFITELPEYYDKIEIGKKRKLFKGEIEFIDSNGDVQIKKQEATAIGMLINFRNRYLGHGLTLDASTAEQLWEEYYPMFKELLIQMSFCKDYPMYKTEHGETFRLQSDELRPIEKLNGPQGNVWLENSRQQVLDILPFFIVPGEVAIAKEDKEQILAYESYTGKTIKFFSPEGTEKQTSGKILERLNMLLRDKKKEQPFSPEAFTKEIFLARVAEENKLILDNLVAEKKVIPGVYVHREDMEIKLREWIGARANIFVMAAEAGSGKTNLLVEIQTQYASRNLPTLLIRVGRMEKTTMHAQLCYLLNIDERENLAQYPAIAGTQENPTFVLIDGLNEAHDAEKLWTELFEISKHFEPGSLKFVVTSRANTAGDINRYKITTEQESFLYGDSKDKENLVSAYTHWLAALSMEEMKQAWEYYVAKDKGKFKPQFDFDDLATFDRALYNQISNPLVLRLFLETYQGKNLPKKGKQHLDIWSDWLSSFTEPEQAFFAALANAIWEKGENELLLDDVLKDEILKSYFTTDKLNSPYPRLRNLGWISRYVKDLNACIGFTVEGALLHLLGKKIESQHPSIALPEIKELLQTGSPLQQSGVGAYLQYLALNGDLDTVCELIDAGGGFIETCVTPIVLHLKTIGVKETLDILFQNPTENDWKALLKVDVTLEELTLHPLRKELAKAGLLKNDFSSEAAIRLGLTGITLINREEVEISLKKIDLNKLDKAEDQETFDRLAKLFSHLGNYDKAHEYFQKCLNIELSKYGEGHKDIAGSYGNIGSIWNNKGDYDRALEFYQRGLEIFTNEFGEKNQNVANFMSLIGDAIFNKGEYEKSLGFYQKSLIIQINNLGEQHPSVAVNLGRIGQVWNKKGDYDKAIEFYQKVLNIEIKIFGDHHHSLATTFNNVAVPLVNKGEYDKALELFQKGLEIQIINFGDQHPLVAITLNNIGMVWDKKGEYDSALEFYQKSLDIEIKTYGNQHPSVANTYNNIGVSWINKEDNDKALEFFQKGLEIQLINLGNQHPSLAETYNNIGAFYDNKGEYDQAIEFYQKSLDVQVINLGDQHPSVAKTYNNIGVVWVKKEEYDKAIEFYQKGLDIEIKTLGKQHPCLATTYNNIGVVWDKKEEYDKAIEFYQKGLVIEIKTLGKQHPSLATTYNNIGVAWDNKGEYDTALEFYQKGLVIGIKTFGKQHLSMATAYNNIGTACVNNEEYDRALESYQKGLDIQIINLGDQHPSVATTFNNIGMVWDKKGEYDKAIEFYQYSLNIKLKNLGEQDPNLATIYSRIGFTWRKKGRFDKALELFKLSLENEVYNLGDQHPSVATNNFYIGVCQKELQMYREAIISLKAGYAIEKIGGYPFRIAECCEALGEKPEALDYYIQSALIRKEDQAAGIEDESTQQSIMASIRLAKELGKESELPEWMNEIR